MDSIERKIIQSIEEHREEIIATGRDIFAHAELGYKEFRTSEIFRRHMEKFGIETEKDLAITGAKGYLGGKDQTGLTVALIGELDALPIGDSPYANPETGAAHCCGHNAQMAAMMGALYGLCGQEVQDAMDGRLVFFAVPAEEFVEIEFKNGLMNQGKIRYGGGKSELIRLGAFDDIDIAVGHHVTPDADIRVMNSASTGFVNKMVRFNGKAAHAADAPHCGVDALNAAALAMQAVNMQLESYRDQDTVRVHGFISHGGDAVNVIADNITMEYSVRANNLPAIENANEKFDRSIRAGAIATGCGAEIITMPGYLPTVPVKDTRAVAEAVAEVGEGYRVLSCDPAFIQGGSTDFGDVSQIMPLLQFHTGGYEGALHDKRLHPVDEELAYVIPAKIFALTAYKLLKNKGEYARALLESYSPTLTREQYIEYMESHKAVETVPMTPIKHML